LNENGTVNGPQNRARKGQAIVVFATGQGILDAAIGTGEPAPGGPLRMTAAHTALRIAGAEAAVFFSGLAPGFVGLLQVNAVLPLDTFSGPAIPIELQVGSVVSQAGVTVAIE
jgi:uncharacterized protein (TIGR03437 family)